MTVGQMMLRLNYLTCIHLSWREEGTNVGYQRCSVVRHSTVGIFR